MGNQQNISESNPKLWFSLIGRIIFTLSIVALFFTLWEITNSFNLKNIHTELNCIEGCKEVHYKIFDVIAYCAWTIGPPVWFMFEYVWLFPKKYKFDSDQLNDLKYVHELGSKVWAAFVICITVILYIKYRDSIFIK
ncbi:hypothetical protein [Flavobacterium sp. ASV13]|uniref:hypothetical protein n=1 Tax=Flavobacterium sp. ASV13 TaxID=1506583 RepID=UPI000556B176|nr:hypothetical protein [Flavobacterium sp. ASV13]